MRNEKKKVNPVMIGLLIVLVVALVMMPHDNLQYVMELFGF